MGFTFSMRVAHAVANGELIFDERPEARFAIPGSTLFELIEALEPATNRLGKLSWYQSSFDYDAGRQPTAGDCFRPRDVLNSLQAIERELQRNAKKYQSSWRFFVLSPDGTRVSHETLNVWYRGRPCRLFSDAQGCWALETGPGPLEGAHHDLSDTSRLQASLAPGAAEETIVLERRSFYTEWADTIESMKRVCMAALEADRLILAST